ncbi:hypothetical protein GCM10010116_34180 [Microbispora rosea subsp. aerata]|nr:hypothetical protein GCM10010116_34180 [Microbispora rosea subsp. aerata]GIH55970.1 hypothetical protein Mro02_28840 [Microbispora rosea subsp. aerata]GLJ87284.1 hypothetical protein GCM10017588_60290 [Microbispora rosea subsp. aerata]
MGSAARTTTPRIAGAHYPVAVGGGHPTHWRGVTSCPGLYFLGPVRGGGPGRRVPGRPHRGVPPARRRPRRADRRVPANQAGTFGSSRFACSAEVVDPGGEIVSATDAVPGGFPVTDASAGRPSTGEVDE